MRRRLARLRARFGLYGLALTLVAGVVTTLGLAASGAAFAQGPGCGVSGATTKAGLSRTDELSFKVKQV